MRVAGPGRIAIAYAAVCALWIAMGGRFLVFPDLWQLLPLPALEAGPVGALWDLHAQPPFLNALLGLSLRAGAVTGIAPERWLHALQLVAGAAAVAALAAVASRIIRTPALRVAALGMVLLNPYLYASVHFFFYTVWELLFLALAAAAAGRYLDGPSPGRAACVLAPALAAVYTRSLFHPLWLVVLTAWVVLQARRRGPWKPIVVVAVTVLALAAIWPVKNGLRFGVWGYSSWAGYNLARGLPVEVPAVMAAFDRPSEVAPPTVSLDPSFRGRPALDALVKPDGSPNWNHPAVIGAARTLGARARALIVRAPHLLLLRAADYYANGYSVYEGRHVYSTGWAPEIAAFPRWARAYEIGAMLAFRPYDPKVTRVTTGFALILPVLIAAAAIVLHRRRALRDDADRMAAALLFCAAWVLVMTLFVDGVEGNRMRFSTQPFWWLLTAWVIERLRTRTDRLRSNAAQGRRCLGPEEEG